MRGKDIPGRRRDVLKDKMMGKEHRITGDLDMALYDNE